jgi:perosamine synthetase
LPQFKIHVAQPNITENDAKAMYDAARSNFLGPGPIVEQFEKEVADYLGVKETVAVNSGTSSMLLSLDALGIKDGDEVITTPFTFAATSNVIIQRNARPIFVDIEPETFNLDPKKIESSITEKTKAIMPIDYGGQSAEIIEINEIATKHGISVIEDAAPALGATHKNKKIGSVSTMSGFSFGPDKNLNTGEGGLISTNNHELAEKCRILRKNGTDGRYHHVMIGWNAKMPDPNAALGISQLKRIDSIIDKKNNLANYYNTKLDNISEITIPIVRDYNKHTFMLYVILFNDNKSREKVRTELEKNGVETRINFPPVHLQPIYRKLYNFSEGMLPICEDISKRVLGLPIFLTMTEEEQDYITDIIQKNCR